jgi:hypothetical protein
MGMRREMRLGIALPVRLSGVDRNGKSFELEATTVDVTVSGARLSGITRLIQPGSTLVLKHRSSQAKVNVIWVGKPGSRTEDHIGIEAVKGGQLNWGRPMPRIPGDGFPRSGSEDFNSVR